MRARVLPICLLVVGFASSADAARRAGLVLITLDTTRADHVGSYGYELDTTPALDGLAREGVLLEQAFANSVNTNPSHASLLTGLLPAAHGNRLNGHELDATVPTLATILSGAGYRSAAFVSGSTMSAAETGFQRGFEVYDDDFPNEWRAAGETVERALAWLRSLPKRQPYFLFVHLFDPHGDYVPPDGFAERFRSGSYPEVGPDDAVPRYQRDGWDGKDSLDLVSRYDGEIAYADSEIGRLLAAVDRKAVVVFAADHGETLLDRYWFFDHGCRLNEEQIRVPLIVRFPERSLRGRRVRGLAQLADVLPTVLSYLEVPAPDGLAGRDLTPHLRKGSIPGTDVVFSEARADSRRVADRGYQMAAGELVISARGERFKLIRYPTFVRPTFELFDLVEDPAEKRDLSSSRPEEVEALRARIDGYLAGAEARARPELSEEQLRKLRSLGYVD